MPGYIPPHLRNKKKQKLQSSPEILADDFVDVPWETAKKETLPSNTLNFSLVKDVEDDVVDNSSLPNGWIEITIDKKTNKSMITEYTDPDNTYLSTWIHDNDNEMMEFIIKDHEQYQEELILSIGIEEYERKYIKHYEEEEEPEIDEDIEYSQYDDEYIESDYDDI